MHEPAFRRPLLEVIATSVGDAVAAAAGGADRLEVCAGMAADGLSPEPATVAGIRQRCDLPLRVMLRLEESFVTSPAQLQRLAGLAETYAKEGADGFVLGFLTPDGEIDVPATATLANSLGGAPWTFHRAIDHVLDADRAWRQVRELPGLTAVLTAGSVRGLHAGLDDLVARARADSGVAELMLAGGGLHAEDVPWLVQAGVRAFHVGTSVRPGGSWKAYVDEGFVRSWRTLLDDEAARLG